VRLDNSAAGEFRKCPLKYFEKRIAKFPGAEVLGIEPATARDDLDFGSRFHALRQQYYCRLAGKPVPPDIPLASVELEAEAQATWAAYLAHWLEEDFQLVEVEQTRVVPLFEYRREPGDEVYHRYPTRHELVVKMDAVIRNKYGMLQVNDLKTERRSSNNNTPEHWAAKPQISLYVYAARVLYPHCRVSDEVLMDFVKRSSPGKQKGPEFWRDTPRRSEQQIASDLRDLIWVADQIETCERTGYFPRFPDACKMSNWRCDFYDLHVNAQEARDAILAKKFQPATPYLDIL